MHQRLAQEAAAMTPVKSMLAALIGLVAATPAFAQSNAPNQPPTPPPRPPTIILNQNDLYRPPPMPQDRAWPAPSSQVAPPMERVPQVAPLAPRVGN
jgi:hypothetical protein